MSKTGVFSMSPIPDIGQLRYLPLKARFCDCFFFGQNNCWQEKILDRVTGWMRFKKKRGESRPSWWCKSLYRICHSTATKDKNSLFLEGLVIRINGHFGCNLAPHTHQRWFFCPVCYGSHFVRKGTVTLGESIIKRAFPGILTKKYMKFPPYIPPWPS
jgi:hypothetical protein